MADNWGYCRIPVDCFLCVDGVCTSALKSAEPRVQYSLKRNELLCASSWLASRSTAAVGKSSERKNQISLQQLQRAMRTCSCPEAKSSAIECTNLAAYWSLPGGFTRIRLPNSGDVLASSCVAAERHTCYLTARSMDDWDKCWSGSASHAVRHCS